MNQVRAQSPDAIQRLIVDVAADLLIQKVIDAQIDNNPPQVQRTRQFLETFKRILPEAGMTAGDPALPGTRAQLAAQLRVTDPDLSLPIAPNKRLNNLEAETPTHATSVAGMCGKINVHIALTGASAAQSADTAVRPWFAVVLETYYFPDLPLEAVATPATPEQLRSTDEACRKLDSHKEVAYIAPDGQQALRLRWLVQAASKALAENAPPFTLECGQFKGDCRQRLLVSLSHRLQTFDCPDGGACTFLDNIGLTNLRITATSGPHPSISDVSGSYMDPRSPPPVTTTPRRPL